VNEYRTPEEDQLKDEHDARVRAALDQAVKDGASLVAAMTLGEPADVVERWVDRLWDGLRDNLRDDRPKVKAGGFAIDIEDRLAAIVLLLEDRIGVEADRVLRGIGEQP
jgi:hypothetical protein